MLDSIFKIRRLWCALILACGVVAAPLAADTPPEDIIPQIDIAVYQHYHQDLLYTHLGDDRGYGPEHDLARANIVEVLTGFGLDVELEPFTYNSTVYYNVVATQVGVETPDQMVVVGAHFDSVGNPGADDNGTGTAAVMELARVLSQHDAHKTVRYVLFDREEQGLVGSYAYVDDHASDDILQAVIMDMIGHDSGAYGVDIYGTSGSSAVVNGLAGAIAAYGDGLSGFTNIGPFAASDHWPFEAAGIPASVMVEDCYSCNAYYHTPNDAVDVEPGYISYDMIDDLLHAVGAYLVEEIGFGLDACIDLADCADLDEDGVRDDNCTWWACEQGACSGVDVVFSDMGGFFGDCAPDGVADSNDRFHALNCFANTDTLGNPLSYPCEPHDAWPATAYNVDAGGSFGDCAADGVCDANDVFHALNAFEGISGCACPLDGAPAPGPQATWPGKVQVAAVRLEPDVAVARGGAVVAVDVFLDEPLHDLRGYQLHLEAFGGFRGALALVDVVVEDRRDHVFAGLPQWSAFNVERGQLAVGLEGPGVAVRGGYLATFLYRAQRHARGTFTVELLHDDSDAAQRTFLFATQPQDRIEIGAAVPAVVQCAGARGAAVDSGVK